MDLYGLVLSIIESQGLVAGLLVYLIIQNDREKCQLLHKICELNHFIMGVLQQKLDEDSPTPKSHAEPSKSRQTEDLLSSPTNTSQDDNLSLWTVQCPTRFIINTLKRR